LFCRTSRTARRIQYQLDAIELVLKAPGIFCLASWDCGNRFSLIAMPKRAWIMRV
jgi:hypothetical protein